MFYNLKNEYKAELATARLEKLKSKGAVVELKEVGLKSPDIRRLYWVWLTCIEKETKQDRNELHYLYRATYLPKPKEEILTKINEDFYNRIMSYVDNFQYFPGMNEVEKIISRSTAGDSLSDYEYSEYLKKIRKHARVNLDVILLTLKEKGFEDFYREYGFV